MCVIPAAMPACSAATAVFSSARSRFHVPWPTTGTSIRFEPNRAVLIHLILFEFARARCHYDNEARHRRGRSSMTFRAIAAGVAASILAASAASAHHSFAAGFDGEKQITLTGTVASVEWTNPHIHFSIDVTGDNGTVTQWRFE